MGFGIPIVSGMEITAGGDETAKHEPGTMVAYKCATDQWAIMQYVQADNNGWASYEAVVKNFATLKQYSVKKSATTDEGAPLVGISPVTVASQYYGWVTVKGYVENAYTSSTTASGEYLCLSGSTAGQLTNNKASCFNTGTVAAGLDGSSIMVVGVANGIYASAAYGSIQLLGMWGV